MQTKLNLEEPLNQWVQRWRNCPEVRGVLLSGSRGAGKYDEHSDYDLLIVVSEEVAETASDTLPKPEDKAFDLWFMPFSLLEASIQNPDIWTPGFMDSEVIFDREGNVTDVMSRLGTLEPEKGRADAGGWLDAYLNAYYRSIKVLRRGHRLGAHLQSADSMQHLLRTLFALNGRLTPYPDRLHLHWDRLKKLPCELEELKERIERILQSGDGQEQIALKECMDVLMRSEGHGEVIDAWGDDLDLARDRLLRMIENESSI